MAEITQTMAEERQASESGSFKMLLKDGPQRFRTRTLLAMGGQMMQQLSGVNLITYVCCRFAFRDLNMSNCDSTTLSFSKTLSACRITWLCSWLDSTVSLTLFRPLSLSGLLIGTPS
jgi:hypothetical protein